MKCINSCSCCKCDFIMNPCLACAQAGLGCAMARPTFSQLSHVGSIAVSGPAPTMPRHTHPALCCAVSHRTVPYRTPHRAIPLLCSHPMQSHLHTAGPTPHRIASLALPGIRSAAVLLHGHVGWLAGWGGAGRMARRADVEEEVEDEPWRRGPPRQVSRKTTRIANVPSDIITGEAPSIAWSIVAGR